MRCPPTSAAASGGVPGPPGAVAPPPAAGRRAPTASACEPYRELIEPALARGRNAMAIWQDLVDDHGFPGRYASVRRFVVKLRGQRTPEAHPVIVTAPGRGGAGRLRRRARWCAIRTRGKYRRTRLFVFTLGYSRKSVRLLTFESSTRRWAELHEESLPPARRRRPRRRPRQFAEGVLTPDVYDPTLNPLYRDVLAHYGAVALPCRVGDPDRKGKVESAIGHTQATPLKGLRFETLDDGPGLSRSLGGALGRHAHPRHHQAPGRRHVRRGAARPAARCPSSPSATTATAPAPCISTAASRSTAPTTPAPPGWIGRAVAVQWDGRQVRLLDPDHRASCSASTAASARGRPCASQPADQPSAHAADHAGAPGPGHPGRGADRRRSATAIHRRDGEPGVRRILGVLALVKKHGPAVVDDACAAALELGVTDLPLRPPLPRAPRPPRPLTLRQVDPLIRELTHYRDVIAQKTQEVPT